MGIVVHLVDATIQSDIDGFESRSRQAAGDIVIKIGAACNGVVQAVSDVVAATRPGTIDALIIYGHGAPGIQGVSMGKDGGGVREGAAITSDILDTPELKAQFARLAKNFSAKGVIVLRGCNSADGDGGKKFITKLAAVSGVPVRASEWFQIVGRTDLAGSIVTATPSGSVSEDNLTGLKNLGGLPPGEGILLLGVEFGDRLLRAVGAR